MAEQLKQYQVGDHTFQLNGEDVKRLKDAGAEVKSVSEAGDGRAPRNKGRQPRNKARQSGQDAGTQSGQSGT